MSVAEVISRMETGASAAPAAPATPPVATEEPKQPVIPAAEQPTADTPAEQPIEAGTDEAVEETEPNLEEQPETSGDFAKYKPLFKENPELRHILGREKAFSELGSFSEVREVMSRVPTLEDAEVLVNDAENKRALSQTFREDRNTFVESLRESDPLAFQQFAKELPGILAQTDESAWKDQASVYVSTVLGNLFQMAQGSNDAELGKAVQLISHALALPVGAAQPARQQANPELERLRREDAARKESDKATEFNNFWGQTDEAIINSTVSEIEKAVKQAVPTATPAQLERMSREVYQKTLDTLGAQPQFTSQIENYRTNASKGRMGIGDHKQIVDFATRRAKLVIPKAAKEVISEWSKSVLQTNSDQIEKKKAIASSTKDPGKGPQGTSSVSQVNPTPAKGPTHLKDVFKKYEDMILGR